MIKNLAKVLLLTVGLFGVVFGSTPIFAASCGDGQVETNVLGNGGCADTKDGAGISYILNIVLTILTFGVGAAGTIGIVVSGIQYMTARDNEQQMAAAKKRIVDIVIGLAVYAVAWAALNWLIPGGIGGGSP